MTVLIIGGGLAGAACAIGLRQHGIDVDVVEKDSFPRPKVCGCCIGVAGLSALSRLGLRDEAQSLGTTTNRWIASLGNRRVELELPEGLAISREVLDPLLIERAADLGAKVTMRCSATLMKADEKSVEVQVSTDATESSQPVTLTREYELVVVAAGLRAGGLNEVLPWTQTPHGPFGVSFMANCASVLDHVIYMACDDDGYVGLVKLADGRVDVAGALRSGGGAASAGNPLGRVYGILARSRFDLSPLVDATAVMTTPPLRRSRQTGNSRVIAIGDAAGYVEPFTGEGMTWAMQSGARAADVIAANDGKYVRIGSIWRTELEKLLGNQKRTCRMVTNALRSPFARRVAAGALAIYPGIAGPLVRGLNRPG